jgi:hypothetical protein
LFLYESPTFIGVSAKVKHFKLINGTHFQFSDMVLEK